MRIRLAVPEAHVGPDVLDAALEAVTRTNESLISRGVVPDVDHAIAAGVVWRPEPPGDEHFDPATTVVARGWGDCDDLAPYAAATRRVKGEDPGAYARVIETNPGNYHAVVQRSDGSIEDPSAAAGMHNYRPSVSGAGLFDFYRPPVQPQIHPGASKPHVSYKLFGHVHVARCDVPWQGTHAQISGHGWGPTFEEAVTEAVNGACVVGSSSGIISPDHTARLMALNALLAQCDPHEVQAVLQAWGHPHASAVVGSLWNHIRVRPIHQGLRVTYVHGVDMLGELVKHLTAVAVQHGVPPHEAHQHAEAAAKVAMTHHGQTTPSVVGSLFGSILKTATSMLPIPGAGLVANMLPDINPFGGGGGGGGAAPAPGAPAAAAHPGMGMPGMGMPGMPMHAPPVTHPPPVVVPIITRF